ncbi:MAG: nodulation protein NfeD, partial [Alphaproteobacteria bacterium]|nr:nodulation protein NfeD [Alphaproteobacteria bacterium]
FLLMNLGTIGLLMEVYNPGSVFPGVAGAICLILGLYSLSVLPTNYAGVALFFLGVAFLAAEFFVTSGGVLGVGGVIAMGTGAFLLFDTDVPGLKVSLPFILGTVGVTAFIVFVVGTYAISAQRRRIATGADNLIGMTGRVVRWSGGEGIVHADGETWRARSEDALAEGQEVTIKALDGLTLVVVAKGDRKKKG